MSHQEEGRPSVGLNKVCYVLMKACVLRHKQILFVSGVLLSTEYFSYLLQDRFSFVCVVLVMGVFF